MKRTILVLSAVFCFVAIIVTTVLDKRIEADQTIVATASTAATVPSVPTSVQLAILRLNVDWLEQATKMSVAATAYNKALDARDADEKTLVDTIDAAIRGANLDPTKWDIDPDKDPMKFFEIEKKNEDELVPDTLKHAQKF